MAKREKIILVIMSVVVLFGLYDFLFSSGARKKPAASVNTVAETNQFIVDVANSLKDDFTDTNMYILNQARGEWIRDPFWHMERRAEMGRRAEAKAGVDSVVASRKETPAQEVRVYTGYLEVGERRLAVINGSEYGPGEEMGMGGPVIKKIDPKKVILRIPGTADEIILPIKEAR